MNEATRLVCTTRAADLDPGDPGADRTITAFRSPRRELRGVGEALRIELPAPWTDHIGRVTEVLRSIPTDDEVRTPGSGPVAFGALPFDRRAAATLVVPAVVFGRSAEGTRWVSTVAAQGGGPATTDAVHTVFGVTVGVISPRGIGFLAASPPMPNRPQPPSANAASRAATRPVTACPRGRRA